MATTIKLKYEEVRKIIDRGFLKTIKRMSNARDLRRGKVEKLISVLKNGKPFSGVFSLNKKGNTLRALDCNHRVQALTEWFDENKDAKIEIMMHIYDNLTDEQERAEFDDINDIVKPNTSDHLKIHWNDLNIATHISKNGFPVTISHKTYGNSIGLHTIFLPYLTRNSSIYSGGFGGSSLEFIEYIKTWNNAGNTLNQEGIEAYNTMREFLKDYISAFGNYTKSSKYWKAIMLHTIFRIWYENKTHFTRDEIIKRFMRLTRGNGIDIVNVWYKNGASRNNCDVAVRDFLSIMNGSKKTNRMFITTKSDGQTVKVTMR